MKKLLLSLLLGALFVLPVHASVNATNAVDPVTTYYQAANGSAIGTAIADFFTANAAFPTVTNGVYEIVYDVYFLKTTAGIVSFTITNTQTYTNLVANASYEVLGVTSGGTTTKNGLVTTTTAAAALPNPGSMADATNQHVTIKALVECGTAGNIRLRATESAGTITPLRGSYYTVRKLGPNSGVLVP